MKMGKKMLAVVLAVSMLAGMGGVHTLADNLAPGISEAGAAGIDPAGAAGIDPAGAERIGSAGIAGISPASAPALTGGDSQPDGHGPEVKVMAESELLSVTEAMAESGSETEAETGSESETKGESEPCSRSETKGESEPCSESAPESESEPGSESETGSESESESEPESESESEPGSESLADAAGAPEEPESGSESMPQREQETDAEEKKFFATAFTGSDGRKITIEARAPKSAKIPGDTELSVEEIRKGTSEFSDAVEAVESEEGAGSGDTVLEMVDYAGFHVSFVRENGEPVKPKAEVKFSVKYTDETFADADIPVKSVSTYLLDSDLSGAEKTDEVTGSAAVNRTAAEYTSSSAEYGIMAVQKYDVKVYRGKKYPYGDYGMGSRNTWEYIVEYGGRRLSTICVIPESDGLDDSQNTHNITVDTVSDNPALTRISYYAFHPEDLKKSGFFESDIYRNCGAAASADDPGQLAGEVLIMGHIAGAKAYGVSSNYTVGANAKAQNLSEALYQWAAGTPAYEFSGNFTEVSDNQSQSVTPGAARAEYEEGRGWYQKSEMYRIKYEYCSAPVKVNVPENVTFCQGNTVVKGPSAATVRSGEDFYFEAAMKDAVPEPIVIQAELLIPPSDSCTVVKGTEVGSRYQDFAVTQGSAETKMFKAAIGIYNRLAEVKFKKTDLATSSLFIKNAVLRLVEESTQNVVAEWTTGEGADMAGNYRESMSGEIQDNVWAVKGLVCGETYELREISAPDGYTAKTIRFRIDEHGNAFEYDAGTDEFVGPVDSNVIVMRNERTKMQFAKADRDTGAYVAGATLAVTDESGKIINLEELLAGVDIEGYGIEGLPETRTSLKWQTTGAPVTVSGLPVGTYYLTELEAPNGYVRSAAPVAFTVTDADRESAVPAVITIENEKTKVRLEKKFLILAGRDNAVTYDDSPRDVMLVLTGPIAKDGAIAAGRYEFPAAGEEFAGKLCTGVRYTLEEKTETLPAIYTKADPVAFMLNETTGQAEILSGADRADNYYGANGETNAELTGAQGDDPQTVTLYDYKLKIQIQKKDERGENLAGAVFALTGGDEDRAVSVDENGWAEITDLRWDMEYTLTETAAPAGYVKADPVTFIIDKDGRVTIAESDINTEVNDENRIEIDIADKDTQLDVLKILTDLAGSREYALKGGEQVVFTLTGPGDGGSAQIAVAGTKSDGDFTVAEKDRTGGTVTVTLTEANRDADADLAVYVSRLIRNLPAGTYTVNETVVPAGFTGMDTATVTVSDELGEDGNARAAHVEVRDTATVVRIRKVDAGTGEMLAGAKLQITDRDGNVVETWTTDGTPHELQAKLNVREDYTLTELEAPEFFEVAEPVTFRVSETEDVTTVTIANRRDPAYSYYNNGELTITKILLGADGREKAGHGVFYAGIFDDPEYTQLSEIVSANIVELNLDGNSRVTDTVEVSLEPDQTAVLYVTEVDADGVPVAGSASFQYDVTVDGSAVEMTNETSVETIITNREKGTKESEDGSGPEPETGGGTTVSRKSVRTGDDTPVALYLALMAAAAAVLILIGRRRRRSR